MSRSRARARERGRGSAVAKFSPSALFSSLFIRAHDLGLADTTSLASITDLSGAGHAPVQATGARQPKIASAVLNGRDVFRFDGTDDFVAVDFAFAQPYTVSLVYKLRSKDATTRVVFDGSAGDTGELFNLVTTNATKFYAGGAAAIGPGTPTTLADGAFEHIIVVANAGSTIVYRNGVSWAVGSGTSPGSGAMGGLTLGAYGARNGTAATAIDVAELGMMSGVISAGPLATLRAYVTSTYNL
jgi:hypothetical protein